MITVPDKLWLDFKDILNLAEKTKLIDSVKYKHRGGYVEFDENMLNDKLKAKISDYILKYKRS